MDAPRIEIYGRQIGGRECPHCTRAKDMLERSRIRFTYFDLTNDPDRRDEFVTRTNGATTVPQIFVGIHRVGGADDLEAAMKSGAIQQIVGGH